MSKSQPNSSFQAVHIQPKNYTQNQLIRAIEDYPLVITTGPAGVGKTFVTVNVALNLLAKGKYRRIVLTRPNIPTGRSLGFFTGDIKDKMEPWLAPMLSEIKERIGTNRYDNMHRRGNLVIQPMETIRGSSFNNSIILVDEAQNLNYEEVKAITTRIGENSKMILMGDPMQTDTKNNGLTSLVKISESQGLEIPLIKFDVNHIVRSDIVRALVIAYMNEENLSHDRRNRR